ncbi:hypothetical protein TWF730_001751 [Orbilia blumenaviensis]|uniref:Spherulin-4 n=1 Tax=Orbilia blumenaviensis TaxID=1796055 RepID=A0AAV9UIJ8_9PEZI
MMSPTSPLHVAAQEARWQDLSSSHPIPDKNGEWVPEKGYQKHSNPLRKHLFVNSGASSVNIGRYIGQSQSRNCHKHKKLQRFTYSVIGVLSAIIILVGYFAFNRVRVPAELNTNSQIPIDEHIASKSQQALQQRATSDQTNIIIPAYFGPENTTSWGRVISQISKFNNVLGFTIIINPSNGPGTTTEVTRYATLIESLAKFNNVNILGYVHQTWGRRDITSDVDTWISYFPGKLDGFFLDEMPSVKSSSNLSAVSNNNAYIKKKAKSYFRNNRSPLIVQNPGTEADASFYSLSYNQDVTIVLENKDDYLSEWIKLDRASGTKDPSELGMILLSVVDNEMSSAVKTMLAYSRYIFATSFDEAQAYTSIPSNWGKFVSAAYKYGGAGSPTKVTSTRASSTKTATKNRSKGSKTLTTKRKFPTTAAHKKGSSSPS